MKFYIILLIISLIVGFLLFRPKQVPVNQRGIPHDWSYSTPERVDENGLPIPFSVDNTY